MVATARHAHTGMAVRTCQRDDVPVGEKNIHATNQKSRFTKPTCKQVTLKQHVTSVQLCTFSNKLVINCCARAPVRATTIAPNLNADDEPGLCKRRARCNATTSPNEHANESTSKLHMPVRADAAVALRPPIPRHAVPYHALPSRALPWLFSLRRRA